MKKRNGHDWGNILVLWSCMFAAITVTAGLETGTIEPILGGMVIFSVAAVGSELVGR